MDFGPLSAVSPPGTPWIAASTCSEKLCLSDKTGPFATRPRACAQIEQEMPFHVFLSACVQNQRTVDARLPVRFSTAAWKSLYRQLLPSKHRTKPANNPRMPFTWRFIVDRTDCHAFRLLQGKETTAVRLIGAKREIAMPLEEQFPHPS